MTTYRTVIDSPRDRDEVFEYLATFSNAGEWDPGVTGAESLTPGPPDVGSVYRLRVRVAGRDVPFDYRVVSIDRPTRVVLQAEQSGMVSTDTITVERAGAGSQVSYVAVLESRGAAASGRTLRRPVVPKDGRPWSGRVASGAGMSRVQLSDLVDAALEASVVGSFSRTGYAARSRLEHWEAPGDLAGRVAIVTGASSGIGRATALELARLGATVWMVGRDRRRTEDAAHQARALGAGGAVEPVVLDVIDARGRARLRRTGRGGPRPVGRARARRRRALPDLPQRSRRR